MITKINEFKQYILENNTISPIRFIESDLEDIIDFVEELLYDSKKIDITEKIAGQHLTVNIKNGYVTVNTKDSLLHGTGDKDASSTQYGAGITRPLIQYLKAGNALPDQSWAFEIVHPTKNHDYIKYDHTDTIFIEYTGTLTDQVANELRKYQRGPNRLLTKSDIRVNVDKNTAYDKFKQEWEGGLGQKYKKLDPRNKGRYYRNLIVDLKFKIGKLLEEILVSVVDKKSPIEGVVASTKTPIKLQTNAFLDVQRIQMSMYSVMKVSKDEINYILDNPLTPFQDLKRQYNISLSSIYKGDLKYSLFDMLTNYLTKNSKLANVDTSKYRVWLTEQESQALLNKLNRNKLNRNNVKDVYMELYNKIK